MTDPATGGKADQRRATPADDGLYGLKQSSRTAAQPADRHLSRFRPIRLKTASDEVVAVLADAIRGGLYQTGDLLPAERDLAQKLGVSRTVVREAIASLRRADVVSVRRGVGGGTVIQSVANLPAVLAGLHTESRDSLRSLLEARRSVEPAAALLAAKRASVEEFAGLERLVALLEDHLVAPEAFFELDAHFHVAIGELSKNSVVAEFQRETFNRISVIRAEYPVGRVDRERAVANQQDTMAALKSRRRARIIASLDNHLGAVEEYFLGERLRFLW